MYKNVKNNDAQVAVNRGVPCESGLCTLCDSACKGKCETCFHVWKEEKCCTHVRLDIQLQEGIMFQLLEQVSIL